MTITHVGRARHLTWVAMAASLVLVGCSGDEASPFTPEVVPQDTGNSPLSWSWLNPSPQSDDLNAIDEAEGTMIAVGEYGVIVVRTAGDTNWHDVPRVVENDLRDVVMIDGTTALAVGDDGIIRTVDGGESWTVVQRLSPGLSFAAIDQRFGIAVAVGDELIFASGDRGATWQPAAIPDASNLRAVAVPSDSLALALSISGKLFRSRDGGRTWDEIAEGQIPIGSRRMAFANALEGVIISGTQVFHTQNSGDSWTRVAQLASSIGDVDFNGSQGLITTVSGEFLRSSNRGLFWTELFGTTDPAPDFNAHDVLPLSTDTWKVVGQAGFIMGTENGGGAWTDETAGVREEYTDLAMSGQTALALGRSRLTETPSLWRSVDGGRNWIQDFAPREPLDVEVFDESLGLLVTEEGNVHRTTNGGVTWEAIGPPPNEAVGYATSTILDADTYLVAGEFFTIHRTTDGGDTWDRVLFAREGDARAAGGTQVLFSMRHFPGTETVVATGSGGTFRSIDGGVSWDAPIILVDALDIACIDSTTAVAITREEILRTTDQGATWDVVESISDTQRIGAGERRGTNEEFVAIAMHGNRGMAVGFLGLMFETVDGGLTWERTDRVTGRDLKGIAFSGSGAAVTMGRDGAILRGAAN